MPAGIIHLDRHVDTQEKDMDEIMQTCPFFHATNIPNCPPANLVQLGIGGWQSPRVGVQTGRSIRTTILTIDDIAEIGIDKTVEIALEVAWKGASAVFLSNDRLTSDKRVAIVAEPVPVGSPVVLTLKPSRSS